MTAMKRNRKTYLVQSVMAWKITSFKVSLQTDNTLERRLEQQGSEL